MTDSAPAPPTLDGDLDVLESIEFIKAEFWLDMLSGAIKVCVNILVAMFLLLIFTTIIKIVLRLVKAIMNNPQRPVPEQLAKFIAAALKIVLWMQIVPILVNKIGIAVDSIVAVVTAIALTIGMSMKPSPPHAAIEPGASLVFKRAGVRADSLLPLSPRRQTRRTSSLASL